MSITDAIGRRAVRDTLALVNRAREHMLLRPLAELAPPRYAGVWDNSVCAAAAAGLDAEHFDPRYRPAIELDAALGLRLHFPAAAPDAPEAEVLVAHAGASQVFCLALAEARARRRRRRCRRRVRGRAARPPAAPLDPRVETPARAEGPTPPAATRRSRRAGRRVGERLARPEPGLAAASAEARAPASPEAQATPARPRRRGRRAGRQVRERLARRRAQATPRTAVGRALLAAGLVGAA